MAETQLPEIPEAVREPTRRRTLPLVWVVPLIAVLVGGWLAVRTFMERGPSIEISFRTAEGIEAGKTKIRLKEVEIGTVTQIVLAPALKGVVVTAALTKQAEAFLVEDTRFWVVRPRIAGAGVSGLGTLLSGAYIGVDVGKSTHERRSFVGLEEPPVLTAGLPGKAYTLRAEDIASIGFGTPVYYRRLQVGEVTGYELDKDGSGVTIKVFVHAPYDGFVTLDTRFWQASGIDVELSASGVRINTESVAALLAGGVAFGARPDGPPSVPAAADTVFTMHRTRSDAMRIDDAEAQTFALLFRESVRGLAVGAPVDFRGIVAGEVTAIRARFDESARQVVIPVEIRLHPDRMRAHGDTAPANADRRRRELDQMVAAGLRAQLQTGNLLTGQLFVALDFFPNAPKAQVDWSAKPPVVPTVPRGLQELQATLSSIAAKLDKVPYEQIGADLRAALRSLDTTLKDVDRLVKRLDSEVAPEVKATLEEARRTFANAERTLATDAPLQQEMREALREVSRAAASVRALTDFLERHPESLIRGRAAEENP